MQVDDISSVVNLILAKRQTISPQRSELVAISGIDGSGKTYLTSKIVAALQLSGVRVAGIPIDGWLNLPNIRFSNTNPAKHYYLNAIRFDEMFRDLVSPLRDHRSVQLEADFAEETATKYRKQTYSFQNVDVIVLEGIYLLKRDFQAYYDLSFWIECSFETALQRAVTRGQEQLSAEETANAYHTIYFPAQEIHFERDDPQNAATAVTNNDPKVG